MRDPWDIVKGWLMGSDSRSVEFTHGGDGGKWYCLLRDEDDDTYDGAGHDHTEALIEAWGAMMESRAL